MNQEVPVSDIHISTVIFILGKGHLSTLEASRDKFSFLLLSAICNRKKNQKNCVSRCSQSRKMTLSND